MSGGQEESPPWTDQLGRNLQEACVQPSRAIPPTATLSKKAGGAIDGLTRKRRSEPKNMLNQLLNRIT